ncbi:TonB-dependent receptor [Temperatibacter marinus]|uniref:TonB-dependent receptor n=1 Tax=Temperatibacter marinus TaxID=1456591 RepID=A0AA52EFX8_9PROT|nr:TonB-dependent receptor [Temperatibacter marinus]WND02095.1 TonB-dependent receptor [Temperatibacter marinus]
MAQLSIKKFGLYAGVSVYALAQTSPVLAQDSDELMLEEIVVTAQKRSENVSDVPLSISAFDGNFTKRTNLDDVKDLIKFSPGFAGNTKDSFIDYVNVRGISTNDFGVGTDPSVAFFKNGFYQGRNGAVVTSMYDMERAEIMRGPQGFLFGRSAIAGAISVHTSKPKIGEFSGYIEGGIGERGIFEGESSFNIPVSDQFAVRIAGYASKENGYLENVKKPNNKDRGHHGKGALRLSALYEGEGWDATLVLEGEERKQSGSVYHPIEGDETLELYKEIFPGVDFTTFNDERKFNASESLGNDDNSSILSATATINYQLDGALLTSMTGYKRHDYQYAEDFGGLPVATNSYKQTQYGDYFEQELRLVGETDGDLDWYAGVSYFDEKIRTRFSQQANENAICGYYYYYYYGTRTCKQLFEYWEYPEFSASDKHLFEVNRVEGDYSGWSAYADLTYAASEMLDYSFGLRYSKETKDFAMRAYPVASELGPWYSIGFTTDGYISDSRSWDAFTPRFTARYRPNDDVMLFASISRGYKAGGFNSFGANLIDADEDLIADAGSTPQSFDAEKVWSYEVGYKATLMNSRLKVDGSLYHYNYKDLQTVIYDPTAFVVNVGKVKATGFEGSAQMIVTENFDLFATISYNKNKFSGAESIEPGSTGNRLPGMPKWTTSGVARYHTDIADQGELSVSLDWRAQTQTFGGLANEGLGTVSGWSDFSFRVGFESDAGWEVTAYVENLFDKIYFDGAEENDDFIPGHYFGMSRPRTVGISFSMPFGD